MAMTHAVLFHEPYFWGSVALQAHLVYARVSLGISLANLQEQKLIIFYLLI